MPKKMKLTKANLLEAVTAEVNEQRNAELKRIDEELAALDAELLIRLRPRLERLAKDVKFRLYGSTVELELEMPRGKLPKFIQKKLNRHDELKERRNRLRWGYERKRRILVSKALVEAAGAKDFVIDIAKTVVDRM